jgi:hypothetical protein
LLIKGRLSKFIPSHFRNFIENSKSEYIRYLSFDYKNNELNKLEYIQNNYDIKCILTIQGSNKNSYISNRCFENISNGYLISTNSELVHSIIPSAIFSDDLACLILNLETIFNDKNLFKTTLTKQLNDYYERFCGNKILNKLIDFCKKSYFNDGYNISLNNFYDEKISYKFWFCKENNYRNIYFADVNSKFELIDALKNKKHIKISDDAFKQIDLDFIINLLKNIPFDIYVDQDFTSKSLLIEEFVKNNITYKFKQKLYKYCIFSSQRSGSTLLIDYIQKLSKNSLCLSEIVNLYKKQSTYEYSYDVVSGILKGIKLQTILECNYNIQEYLKQFEDLAIFQDKVYLIYKITIDISKSLDDFYMLSEIMNYIKVDTNIIYLQREIKDIYISKVLADIYGYSNSLYKNLKNNIFSHTEVKKYNENLKITENLYLMDKIYNNISYTDICNNLDNMDIYINKIFNKDNLLPKLIDSDYYNIVKLNINKNNSYFNSKQNNFSLEELNNPMYWTD